MDKKIYIIPLILSLIFIPSLSYGDYFNYMPWRWNQNPSICINFDNDTSHYKYQVIKAIDDWKIYLDKSIQGGRFDYKLFVNSTNFNHSKDCNVFFNLDVPLKDYPSIPSDAYGYTDCGGTMCEVAVFDTVPSNYLSETVKHEMGHVLGLGHRLPFTKCDLMSLVESNDIMMGQAGPFRWITVEDIKALASDYGLGFDTIHPPQPNKYIISNPPECA